MQSNVIHQKHHSNCYQKWSIHQNIFPNCFFIFTWYSIISSSTVSLVVISMIPVGMTVSSSCNYPSSWHYTLSLLIVLLIFSAIFSVSTKLPSSSTLLFFVENTLLFPHLYIHILMLSIMSQYPYFYRLKCILGFIRLIVGIWYLIFVIYVISFMFIFSDSIVSYLSSSFSLF